VNYIPEEQYNEIKKVLPVFRVDLVARMDGTVLLCKRLNEPLKGMWCFPGSRLQKNESMKDAVTRIAMSELGISVSMVRVAGFYNLVLSTVHTPVLIVAVKPLSIEIRLDEQHSEYRFADKSMITKMALCTYVRDVIHETTGLLHISGKTYKEEKSR